MGGHVAPYSSVDEVVSSAHLQEREFFHQMEHPVAGPLTYPGAPYRLSRTPWQLRSPAPTLGEDTLLVVNLSGRGDKDVTLVRQILAERTAGRH